MKNGMSFSNLRRRLQRGLTASDVRPLRKANNRVKDYLRLDTVLIIQADLQPFQRTQIQHTMDRLLHAMQPRELAFLAQHRVPSMP
jgi:hypothetical protein